MFNSPSTEVKFSPPKSDKEISWDAPDVNIVEAIDRNVRDLWANEVVSNLRKDYSVGVNYVASGDRLVIGYVEDERNGNVMINIEDCIITRRMHVTVPAYPLAEKKIDKCELANKLANLRDHMMLFDKQQINDLGSWENKMFCLIDELDKFSCKDN